MPETIDQETIYQIQSPKNMQYNLVRNGRSSQAAIIDVRNGGNKKAARNMRKNFLPHRPINLLAFKM